MTQPSLPPQPPSERLSRRLNLGDAVTIGMGSMIGAGIFAAVGPAAAAGGSWMLVGLLIAAVVAYANATSSAQLAASMPDAGGTYAYGRRRLGPFWGHLAGWGFVVGKTASLAAMALTFAAYTAPGAHRPVAIAAVLILTVVNYSGVRRTALVTRIMVAVVLAALAVVVAVTLGTAPLDTSHLALGRLDVAGVLQSAGLLFFAFAGYARIATLGEEVVDPERTIPRAIPRALLLTLGVYAVVITTALVAVGPEVLAHAAAPLAAAAAEGPSWTETVVRVGAAVGVAGVLLSLLAGVSRTLFAMARNGEMPHAMAAVHPTRGTPHVAELVVGLVVVAVVVFADLRGAIGFSSFSVLVYYAIANVAAYRQPSEERRWPKWFQMVGLVGCLGLAATLPSGSVLVGSAVLVFGALVWSVRNMANRRRSDS